ncbi:ankyrin repeat domain-containing protein 26-like [Heliangelus exortis]|uniref:ankyrin repeat domain-containing protein 26-like n=1 Tax=Heliangelus exortis TaxID=472823 RepID=UPI003A8D27DA
MEEPRIDDGHQVFWRPLKASTGSLPAVAAEKKKSVRFLGTSSSDSEKESYQDEEDEEEPKWGWSSEEEKAAVPTCMEEPMIDDGHQAFWRPLKASTGEHSASTFRVSSPAEKGGLKDGTEESGVQEPGPQLQRESSQLPLLHQLLEDVQEQDPIQGRAVPVALGWLHNIYQKLTAATEKYVYLVEERNKNLKAQCAALKKQVLKYKADKGKREDTVRQLQQELAAALKKLSVAEGSLEESTRCCRALEEANLGLRKELEEAEDKDTVRQLQQELAAALKKLSVAEGSLEESTRRCRTLEEANLGLRKELEEAEDKDTVRQLQQELAAALKKLSVAEGSLEESTRRCRALEEANLGLRKELEEAEDKDTVRQLQQELAAALKKLSVAEGSLEESTRCCRTLEEANLGLRKELGKAKTKCQELEKQQLHSEHHIQYWMSTFEDRERELREKSQKVQDLLSFSLETRARVKQLEQRVQCLSLENTRLEGKVKQQRSWIEALRGDVEASASACQLGRADNQQRRSTGSCRGATSPADEERA